MARTSIFGEKDGDRVQGELTSVGSADFEHARSKLADIVFKIAGVRPKSVSDGDTIEFLARGEAETKVFLKDRY